MNREVWIDEHLPNDTDLHIKRLVEIYCRVWAFGEGLMAIVIIGALTTRTWTPISWLHQ